MSIYGDDGVIGDLCLAIQENMENVAGTVMPMQKRTKNGYLDALQSELNISTFDVIPYDQGNGQHRDVRLEYWQRETPDDIDGFSSNFCNVTGNDKGMKTETFSICQSVSHPILIKEAQAAQLCEGMNALYDKRLRLAFDAIRVKKNILLLQTQLTHFGVNASTGTNAAVTKDFVDNTANGQIKGDVWAEFMEEVAHENEMGDIPIIVGGSGFSKFNRILKMSCCNDAGIDPLSNAEENGFGFFYDRNIDDTIGANECVVMEPGSVQEVTYLKYRLSSGILDTPGSYAAFESTNGGIFKRGVIVDPMTGEPYDCKVELTCDDEILIYLEQNFDLHFVPSDLYKAADNLSGYNGSLRYILT